MRCVSLFVRAIETQGNARVPPKSLFCLPKFARQLVAPRRMTLAETAFEIEHEVPSGEPKRSPNKGTAGNVRCLWCRIHISRFSWVDWLRWSASPPLPSPEFYRSPKDVLGARRF